MNNRIYLDNAATTPILPEVLHVLQDIFVNYYGNPSSTHEHGRKAKSIIEESRNTIAKILNCSSSEIIFTSGGTEADNLALRSAVVNLGVKNVVSSPIEHHAVSHTLEDLAKSGAIKLHLLAVDDKGKINYDDLKNVLQNNVNCLVSLMHANNEIGTMINIETVSKICTENNALFHCDTVQTIGNFPIDLKQLTIDFICGAAHKFNGPKGVGFLYINKKNKIKPLITGGAQEREIRSGTENVAGIAAMAKALELNVAMMNEKEMHYKNLKTYLKKQLENKIPGITFNGDIEGLCSHNVLSVNFPDNEFSSMLLFNLDLAGISVSEGSACSSGAVGGSHVINCIKPNLKGTTIRFSFGKNNTIEELDILLQKLEKWFPVAIEA